MIGSVILMCAGRAERWGRHLGVHKHLIPIDGERLLDRTLRLVRRHTPDAPVVIVAFDPQYARDGCERFEPAHGPVDFCDTDKFLSAESRWADRGQTVILYGDVFFTEAAMATILSYTGPHRFFGRREGSFFTGRPWREMFALSFPADERHWMHDQLLRLRHDLLTGRSPRGGGWELFHQLHGRTWDNFIVIDDFTDDFDFPSDFDRWFRRWSNPLHRRLAPVYAPLIKRAHWRWRQARRLLTLRQATPTNMRPCQ
jgi:hypothetical protein